MSDDSRLPAGRPPWDPLNGMRIGGVAGGVIGVLATLLLGASYFWLVAIGAVAGGAIGYWSEKRKQTKGP